MRKFLLSVICACISIYATAQDITHNTIIDEQLSSIFQNMELQRVPTGYLLDRAVEAVRNLHITESERAFCEGYVVQLNEMLKEK